MAKKITANYFDPPKSNRQFSEGQKSKGILDDYSERQNVDTQEGTIEKEPVENKDISNKEYVNKREGLFVDFDVPGIAQIVDYNIIEDIVFTDEMLQSATYKKDAATVATINITYDSHYNPSVITVIASGTTYESTFTYTYDGDVFTKVERSDTEV